MAEQIVVRDSQQGYSPELALFDLPVQNSGINKIQWIPYSPINDFSQDGSLEFRIFGSGIHYIDLKRTRLHVTVKITQADGSALPAVPPGISNIPDEARVGPVNNFMHSLWRQLDVFLNDKLITTTETTYSYRAMMDTMLNTANDVKATKLQAQLFYPDRLVNEVTDIDPITGTNYGLVSRSLYFRQSKLVDMEGPLLASECQLDRYLLNGIKINIKLYPSSDAFRLISPNSDANFKVVITSASLKVCCITPTPEVLIAHQAVLNEDKKAYYPYMRSELKRCALSAGQFSVDMDDVFLGRVPSQIIVCMVKSEALSGSYGLNPYVFKSYKINYLNASLDGESFPTKALQPVFIDEPVSGNYIDAYLRMFESKDSNTENGISREDFAHGKTLFCFDFNPDLREGRDKSWPLLRKGNLHLEIQFAEALPEAATVLVYGTFPSCIEVDKTRNITFM